MPGASALAAAAALGARAGYVRLIGPHVAGLPHAIVQGPGDPATLLADARIGAVVIGPGLGKGAEAERLLDLASCCGRPLVLDADALIAGRIPAGAIFTPHEGEFARLFPGLAGDKVGKARAAAAETGSVIVYKGADTIVAAPDGRAAIAPPAPAWLATPAPATSSPASSPRGWRRSATPMAPPARRSGSTAAPPSAPAPA